MSIQILHQVYAESRRLAIAGSQLAKGDFRLKKLVAPLEKAGAKSPVFSKVADAISAVIDSPDKSSAAALLELSTLVSAILYTQGATGEKGKISDLKNEDLGIHSTRASARVLAPVLEALSNTGSGRLETIRDAHTRGAFLDLRLVKPALGGLDDGYGEIADLVADEILPQFGAGILAAVKDTYDYEGKGGHARRLRLMHKLDPAGTREAVMHAFEHGSKEVKVAAIACLGGSKSDLPILLEQAKVRNRDVRAAALEALANFSDAEAVEVLKEALRGNDIDLAVAPVRANRSPKLLAYVLDEARARIDALLAPGDPPAKKKTAKKKTPATAAKKTAKKAIDLELKRLGKFLQCLSGKKDKKAESFLVDLFARRDEFYQVIGVDVGGAQLVAEVSNLLLAIQSNPALDALAAASTDLRPEYLANSFFATALRKTPKLVYDKFSPHLIGALSGEITTAKVKKQYTEIQRENHDVLTAVIEGDAYQMAYNSFGGWDCFHQRENSRKSIKWDKRWMDLVLEQDNIDAVLALSATFPKHPKLARTMKKRLGSEKGSWKCGRFLEVLIELGDPEATDLLIDVIRKGSKSKRFFYGDFYYELIELLPKSSAPKIEALIKELPEQYADEVLPYLVDLQGKK